MPPLSPGATPPALAVAAPPVQPAERRSRRGWRVDADLPGWVLPLLVAVGTALRVRQFAFGRPLWTDELFLALNIVPRSAHALADRLAWDQSAPPLYVWLERLCVHVLGPSEYALRLPALLAGVLLLPLVWHVAARLTNQWGAALATAASALSPLLIYFSNELKPYAVDAAVTLALVALTLRQLDRPGGGRLLALAVAGVWGVLLSTPAVFTLAGVGAALLVPALAARSARRVGWLAAMGGAWLATFGLVYATVYRHSTGSAFLQSYFGPTFLLPSAPDLPHRAMRAVWEVTVPTLFWTESPLRGPFWLLATVGVVGLAALGRRHGASRIVLLVAPMVAACAASMVGRYPIIARTMLFVAPLSLIAITAGFMWLSVLYTAAPRVLERALFAAAAAAFLWPAARASARHARNPIVREDTRPLIAALQAPAVAADPVYLSRRARGAWAYYTTDWERPDGEMLRWIEQAHGVRAAGEADPLVAPPPAGGGADDPYTRVVGGRRLVVQHLPTGLRITARGSRVPPNVPQWAAAEAERVVSAARPRIWMLTVDRVKRVDEPLLDAVRARGADVVKVSSVRGAALYRVTMPATPR